MKRLVLDDPVSTVDAHISERVYTLTHQWNRQVTLKELSAQTGITESSLSRKVSGKSPWWADDVYRVAAALDVPVTDLLPERARGDSNSQHTGYYVRPHTYPPAVLIPAQRQPASRTVTP